MCMKGILVWEVSQTTGCVVGKPLAFFLLKESSERITEFIMPSSYQDTLFTFLWSISLSYCMLPVAWSSWYSDSLCCCFSSQIAIWSSCCCELLLPVIAALLLWLSDLASFVCINKLVLLPPCAIFFVSVLHLLVSFKLQVWGMGVLFITLCHCRSFKSSSVPASVISRSCCVWLLWQDSKWVEEKQYLLRTNQELREKVH